MNLMQLLTNENTILINILSILVSIIETVLFYKFFTSVLNIRSTKKERNIFILGMAVACCITFVLPNNILKDSISIASFLMFLIFIFHQNIRNSFIALISSYLCAFITEYISEPVIISLLKCSRQDILTVPLYYLSANLLAIILFIFIILIIKLIKNKKLRIFSINIPLKASIVITLILGIFTMVLESYLLSIYTEPVQFELTLVVIITLLLYFIISMYSIIRTNSLEKTEMELHNEIMYNKTLILLHDNIRCFKHDFNNIIQSIGGYIALNDIEGLTKYYNKLLEECKITNNLNLLSPEVINNPSLYSLLTNKYYTASSKNINISFSVFTDLSNINFNMYELTRILGILIDNAIEAAEETSEKIVEIEISSDNRKHKFIIRNSCKDSNISTTKIFEKGYSTKNRNSGIGLWKVHKILSKNTNLDLFTTVKDNIFSQQLEIFY